MKLSDIKANPDNPRVIKDEAFNKLVQSIKDFPKMMALRPMVVDDNLTVLGGNMRLRALRHLGYKDIPDEWVKRASDLTEEEQKQFIIKDNVSVGDWDWDTLANEWDVQDLKDWGLEMPADWGVEPEPEDDDKYTKKLEAPKYKITEEKPEAEELTDDTRYNELIGEIDAADIPEEDREFLKKAAVRHIVFNYTKIAEYYAHASKEVQELMENSALVIIDYNKAIELGYVQLSKQILDQYSEEYGNEE